MEIKVSVIVPVYNVEKYLDRCIKTILNQTLKEIEVILVDDGSKDSSGKMCDLYKKQDSRIKVIHKENAGLGYARNSGLEVATGKYVAFIDSDDYIDLEMFESLYNYAENYKCEAVMCAGNKRVDSNGNIIEPINENKIKIYEGNDVKEKLLLDIIGSEPEDKVDAIIGVSVAKAIYLKAIFDKNNIRFCSEKSFISEDAIFQLDFIPYVKKAIVIPESYYYYCQNFSSLSLSYKKDRFEKNLILYKEQIKKIENIGIYKCAKSRVDRMFIANIRLSIMQETRNKRKENFEEYKGNKGNM